MASSGTMFVAMPLNEFQELIEKMINDGLEKFSRKPIPVPTDELLSIEEVCTMLHVSKVTIHKWKKRKLIFSYRIGRKIYFKRQEVISCLNSIIIKR